MHFLEHILLLRIDIVQSNKKTKQKTKKTNQCKSKREGKIQIKKYCMFWILCFQKWLWQLCHCMWPTRYATDMVGIEKMLSFLPRRFHPVDRASSWTVCHYKVADTCRSSRSYRSGPGSLWQQAVFWHLNRPATTGNDPSPKVTSLRRLGWSVSQRRIMWTVEQKQEGKINCRQ